jgi:hypothetical protein
LDERLMRQRWEESTPPANFDSEYQPPTPIG